MPSTGQSLAHNTHGWTCIFVYKHIYTFIHILHPLFIRHDTHGAIYFELNFDSRLMFNVFFFTLYFQQRLPLLDPAANECELYLTSFFLILYFFALIFVYVYVFVFYICICICIPFLHLHSTWEGER